VVALASAAGVVVYSATAGARLPEVVAGIGAAGLVLVAVALAGRWHSVLPLGLVGVGSAYAVYLSLRSDTIDSRAPLVAAALFVAAESAYWSLERQEGRAERAVPARRIGAIAAGAFGTALVGGVLLVVAGGAGGGLALEAVGVVAAVLLLGVIAFLAGRAGSTQPRR
jgi:hypothetical protein